MSRLTDLAARVRDLSECLWWDWGYEENHTHKGDRDLMDEAAAAMEEADAHITALTRDRDTNIAEADRQAALAARLNGRLALAERLATAVERVDSFTQDPSTMMAGTADAYADAVRERDAALAKFRGGPACKCHCHDTEYRHRRVGCCPDARIQEEGR